MSSKLQTQSARWDMTHFNDSNGYGRRGRSDCGLCSSHTQTGAGISQ